jgi:cytochrome c-type biogenesis protein CcmH
VKLAAVVVLALLLAVPAVAAGPPSESSLETQLVCPVCHETLDQSTAPVAVQMKQEIRRRIAQGWTRKQILDEMVANYGPGVLSTPATHGFDLLAWVLPVGGIALGAAGLAGGAWYWSRSQGDGALPEEEYSLAPEDERRVDEELARLDA